MRALSVYQPWASAIAMGTKLIETRAWATQYRGPLLIHAARTTVGIDVVRKEPELWFAVLQPTGSDTVEQAFRALPFGAVVARCELVDCIATADVESIRAACRLTGQKYSTLERRLGNYERGRWAWLLSNVQPLAKPFPLRAQQGLFEAELPATEGATT